MPRNIGYLTAKKTKLSDECYTPKYAVLPVLEFLNIISIGCRFSFEFIPLNELNLPIPK